MDPSLQNRLYAADAALAVSDEHQPAPRGNRRGPRLPRSDSRQIDLCGRQGSDRRPRPRLASCRHAGPARPHRRPLDGDDPRAPTAGRQAGLLPVAGVPDRPAAARRRSAIWACSTTARAALAELGVDLDWSPSSSPTRRSAMAASAASPPASWRAWRPSGIPAYGYGIRYDHGMFRQEHQRRLAGRVARGLADLRQSVGIRAAARSPTRSASAARVEARAAGDGTAVMLGAGRDRAGRRLRHPDRRLARPARQHAAAVVGQARSTRSRLDAFNRGDHVGALAERDRAESISRVLYPERRDAGRPGAAPAAGVFLHLRLAAGHRAPPHAAASATSRTLPDKVAIQLNDTHPAIAVAELMRLLHRRPRARLGRGLGDHPRDASPTPTTRCCRRRWRPGRCAVRAAAAAPHADHLRHQRPLPRPRRARASATTPTCSRRSR